MQIKNYAVIAVQEPNEHLLTENLCHEVTPTG